MRLMEERSRQEKRGFMEKVADLFGCITREKQ
jgi:hypothetical protein